MYANVTGISTFTCSNVASYSVISGSPSVTQIDSNTYKFQVSASHYLGKDGSGWSWIYGAVTSAVVEITLE